MQIGVLPFALLNALIQISAICIVHDDTKFASVIETRNIGDNVGMIQRFEKLHDQNKQ